jgi:hypothetical protein
MKMHGIGLVECLVAVLMASLIILCLVQEYVHFKQHYVHIKMVLEEEMDQVAVVELMRDSIKKSGFTPCLNMDALHIVDGRHGKMGLKSIEIGDVNSKLTLRRMSEEFNAVLKVSNPRELWVDNTYVFKPQDAVMVSTCYEAEIQTIASVHLVGHSQKITFDHSLSLHPEEFQSMYIGEFLEESFYIHDFKHKRSLFYDLHHADELSPYIHSMAIQFKKKDQKKRLDVRLGLSNAQSMDVSTFVRS